MVRGVRDFDARVLAQVSGVATASATRWLRNVLFIPQATHRARWPWDDLANGAPRTPSLDTGLALLVLATGATAAPPKRDDWGSHDANLNALRKRLVVAYRRVLANDPEASFNGVATLFIQEMAKAKGVGLGDGRGTTSHVPGLLRGAHP